MSWGQPCLRGAGEEEGAQTGRGAGLVGRNFHCSPTSLWPRAGHPSWERGTALDRNPQSLYCQGAPGSLQR